MTRASIDLTMEEWPNTEESDHNQIPSNNGNLQANHSSPELAKTNRQKERSQKNIFGWGAAFGAFTSTSTILLYIVCCLSTEDPEKQIGRIYPIPFFPIALGTPIVLGLLNLLRIRYSPADKQKPEKPDINELFEAVVVEDQLDYSTSQKIAFAGIIVLFTVANAYYCRVFKHISDEAVGFLPDDFWWSEFFNSHTGLISYGANFFLNQWFAYSVSRFIFNAYNEVKLIQKLYYHNDKIPKGLILKALAKVFLPIILATSAFVALTYDDPKIEEDWDKAVTAFLCAIPVFGFLNADGAETLIRQIASFWNWLNTFPKPPEDLAKTLKDHSGYKEGENKPHYYLFGLAGYPLYNMKECSKELAYLLWIEKLTSRLFGYKPFLTKNDLELPSLPDDNTPTESTVLIDTNNHDTSIQVSGQEAENPKKRPEVTLEALEDEVAKRIRKADHELGQPAYIELLKETRVDLEKKRIANPTWGDIWKQGRTRRPLILLFGIAGASTLSMVLTGYFQAILSVVAKYIPALEIENAETTMATLIGFSSFIALVLASGWKTMRRKVFGDLLEGSIKSMVNSDGWKTMRRKVFGDLLEGSIKSMVNSERPKPKVIRITNVVTFSLIAVVFAAAPSSAGTVIKLLSELAESQESALSKFLSTQSGKLAPFFLYNAYWGTALFNTVGIVGFLLALKSWIIDACVYSDKKQARPWKKESKVLDWHNKFFSILKNPRGLEFNINELDPDKATTVAQSEQELTY